jgi:hypothetical protein
MDDGRREEREVVAGDRAMAAGQDGTGLSIFGFSSSRAEEAGDLGGLGP